MHAIGVDCATDPKNVGLALAEIVDGKARVLEVAIGDRKDLLESWVVTRISRDEPVLLAMDAPLGWPSPLGTLLANHRAGDPTNETAHRLFRRTTDDCISARLGKRPLDVGADRIARCAHAALALLASVRRESRRPIPLAWVPGTLAETSCIEVYPGATLESRGVPSKGYKGKDGEAARSAILAALSEEIQIPPEAQAWAIRLDHVLDAIICVLAALDFSKGDVIGVPESSEASARREGWIWARPRGWKVIEGSKDQLVQILKVHVPELVKETVNHASLNSYLNKKAAALDAESPPWWQQLRPVLEVHQTLTLAMRKR